MSGLAEVLTRAGIPAQIGASEAQVLWSKLVRLAPLACTTSVADQPIGFIRTDPHWRAVMLSAIGEVVAVANAEGAQIDPATPLAELESAHATLGSSMQRDLAARREPEVEAIPGAVLRAARAARDRVPDARRAGWRDRRAGRSAGTGRSVVRPQAAQARAARARRPAELAPAPSQHSSMNAAISIATKRVNPVGPLLPGSVS